ncbi:hypothetical protein HID58_034368 [Brassica napus]|uniref:Sucrose-phosphatase C-terminal domain-containing protein n=1 Tax=Brassica napus TaxID=3708 RepID=A0ABQ8C2U8_BRANA|nr:hypothetical protein HID58_034368 [Brassica napus]
MEIEEGKLRTHPGGVFVHPYGAEKSLRDTIDELGKNHGDKKDKKFPIWTDQVLATEATPRTWIVKLNKWEQTGNAAQQLSNSPQSFLNIENVLEYAGKIKDCVRK